MRFSLSQLLLVVACLALAIMPWAGDHGGSDPNWPRGAIPMTTAAIGCGIGLIVKCDTFSAGIGLMLGVLVGAIFVQLFVGIIQT